jgi:hypothetical protein
MAHMDGIIWAYPPAVGLPPELDIVADKVMQTGPFLDLDAVPEKAAARARLGFADDEQIVVYAPRGFPFGEEFGQTMLAGLFSAVEGLRGARFPKFRLVLLAVDDPAQLRRVGGMPDELPSWVTVLGVVTPPEALVFAQAADILIGEGTSTIHEGAALRTPLVVVPGPIQEILRLAKALKNRQAAHVLDIAKVTADTLADVFATILGQPDRRDAMTGRAHALVTGGGGVMAAARLVLDLASRHRATFSGSAEHLPSV